MILHEIASKLANVFNKWCKDPQSAALEAEPIINELYRSLGGCDFCYGRGYILLEPEYDYCKCERGRQLEKFVEGRE